MTNKAIQTELHALRSVVPDGKFKERLNRRFGTYEVVPSLLLFPFWKSALAGLVLLLICSSIVIAATQHNKHKSLVFSVKHTVKPTKSNLSQTSRVSKTSKITPTPTLFQAVPTEAHPVQITVAPTEAVHEVKAAAVEENTPTPTPGPTTTPVATMTPTPTEVPVTALFTPTPTVTPTPQSNLLNVQLNTPIKSELHLGL